MGYGGIDVDDLNAANAERNAARAEIATLRADLARVEAERDAAIAERDARPDISREDARDFILVFAPAAHERVLDALRAHAKASGGES